MVAETYFCESVRLYKRVALAAFLLMLPDAPSVLAPR